MLSLPHPLGLQVLTDYLARMYPGRIYAVVVLQDISAILDLRKEHRRLKSRAKRLKALADRRRGAADARLGPPYSSRQSSAFASRRPLNGGGGGEGPTSASQGFPRRALSAPLVHQGYTRQGHSGVRFPGDSDSELREAHSYYEPLIGEDTGPSVSGRRDGSGNGSGRRGEGRRRASFGSFLGIPEGEEGEGQYQDEDEDEGEGGFRTQHGRLPAYHRTSLGIPGAEEVEDEEEEEEGDSGVGFGSRGVTRGASSVPGSLGWVEYEEEREGDLESSVFPGPGRVRPGVAPGVQMHARTHALLTSLQRCCSSMRCHVAASHWWRGVVRSVLGAYGPGEGSWRRSLWGLGFWTLGDEVALLEKEIRGVDKELREFRRGVGKGAGMAFVVFRDAYAARRALTDRLWEKPSWRMPPLATHRYTTPLHAPASQVHHSMPPLM